MGNMSGVVRAVGFCGRRAVTLHEIRRLTISHFRRSEPLRLVRFTVALTGLLQLAAFPFWTIKYWSGFAGDFGSPTSKYSAK
jgi:hypothetical protein